ncbi:MAG: YajG family lipoprotein [Psychromonas sp.]
MIYLHLKKIRTIALALSALFLFSCSSTSSTMLLEPEIVNEEKPQSLNNNINWSLSSQDQRIAHYLIEISTGDDVATLINEEKSSRLIIQKALHEQWKARGLKFTDNSDYKIDIQLIKLLGEVEQASFNHQLNSNIVIKVKLSSEQQIFSKTFTSHFYSKRPFSANSDKISEQLNDQLSQLLNEIIQDPELNTKLQQF